MVVAGDAEEQLLPVRGIEGLIHGPRAAPRRHRRRLLAGHGVPRHVLADQKRRRLEQSAPDQLSPPGALTLLERCERCYHAEHAAQDVDHRGAGAQRLAGWPGHMRETGHELHDLVQRRAPLVRAGEKPLERNVHEAGVLGRQALEVAAQALHGAGSIVLDDDVGRCGKALDERPPLRRLEVDREAPLVAVEVAEKADGEARQTARVVAIGRRLHLDDVAAEVGEHEARGRPHDRVAELQHAKARERQILLFVRSHELPPSKLQPVYSRMCMPAPQRSIRYRRPCSSVPTSFDWMASWPFGSAGT